MANKIRPNAEKFYNMGNDGRDAYWDIKYTCPQCREMIQKNIMGCDRCGIFFDWSKTAKVRVVHEIVWE